MRTRSSLICSIFLCSVCFGATPSGSADVASAEGILLGFSSNRPADNDHDSAQQFSTAWIVRHGETAELVAVLPYLIVPRPTGFWRIGIENVCEMYGENNEYRSRRDIVWSGPADVTPHLNKGPECPAKPQGKDQPDSAGEYQSSNGGPVDRYTDCLYRSRTISFVSPNYISESAEEANTEACEARGGRVWAWSRVLSITTPEMRAVYGSEEQGPMAKALSDFADQNPKRAADAFKAVFTKEDKDVVGGGSNCPEAAVDYQGWEIRRKDGMWIPWISQQLFLGFSGDCVIDASVPVRLPSSLAGRNRVVPALGELKKAFPELTDAFTSPRGNTTIVITSAKVLVFSVSGEKLGTKLLEVDFPNGATPVMEQWAIGTYVESWTQQVQQWKIHPPPSPVISSDVKATQ
jgi:hypothetical protein